MKRLIMSNILYIFAYIAICHLTLSYLYFYTNYYSSANQYLMIHSNTIAPTITVGALTVSFLLLCGMFLLSLRLKRPDWSSLLLIASFGIQTMLTLATTYGSAYLPNSFYHVLTNNLMSYVPLHLIVFYLLLKQDKNYVQYFSNVMKIFSLSLIIIYLLSRIIHGNVATFVDATFQELFVYGQYTTTIRAVTIILQYICVSIAFYCFAKEFTYDQLHKSALEFKKNEAIENFAYLQSSIAENSDLVQCLQTTLSKMQLDLNAGHYNHLQSLVDHLNDYINIPASYHYTNSAAVNTLLTTYVNEAKKYNINFQLNVNVPETVYLPDCDLCSLLINMIDNAREANQQITNTSKRYIHMNISYQGNFLFIHCVNPYIVEPILDFRGNLKTTKTMLQRDALGLQLMDSIASNYGSSVCVEFKDSIFSVHTALKLELDQSSKSNSALE